MPSLFAFVQYKLNPPATYYCRGCIVSTVDVNICPTVLVYNQKSAHCTNIPYFILPDWTSCQIQLEHDKGLFQAFNSPGFVFETCALKPNLRLCLLWHHTFVMRAYCHQLAHVCTSTVWLCRLPFRQCYSLVPVCYENFLAILTYNLVGTC